MGGAVSGQAAMDKAANETKPPQKIEITNDSGGIIRVYMEMNAFGFKNKSGQDDQKWVIAAAVMEASEQGCHSIKDMQSNTGGQAGGVLSATRTLSSVYKCVTDPEEEGLSVEDQLIVYKGFVEQIESLGLLN